MKLLILFCLLSMGATAQPAPFKPGPYKIGDQVTYLGKVFIQLKGCAKCSATPENNTYWKQREDATVTIDSVLKLIDFRDKEIAILKAKIDTTGRHYRNQMQLRMDRFEKRLLNDTIEKMVVLKITYP